MGVEVVGGRDPVGLAADQEEPPSRRDIEHDDEDYEEDDAADDDLDEDTNVEVLHPLRDPSEADALDEAEDHEEVRADEPFNGESRDHVEHKA